MNCPCLSLCMNVTGTIALNYVIKAVKETRKSLTALLTAMASHYVSIMYTGPKLQKAMTTARRT